jgi:hypothetical protein
MRCDEGPALRTRRYRGWEIKVGNEGRTGALAERSWHRGWRYRGRRHAAKRERRRFPAWWRGNGAVLGLTVGISGRV